MPTSHDHHHGGPVESRPDHTKVSDDGHQQAPCPDGTDDWTQDAVSEDGEVGERTDNDGTLDNGHGSQMPQGTEIAVRPTL